MSVSSTAQSLKALKRELRRGVMDKLGKLSQDVIMQQSTTVKNHICSSEVYNKSNRISLYLSMQHAELNTDELARQIIKDGKKLFVPFIHQNEVPTMTMLNIKSLEQLRALKRNKWGIPEVEQGDYAQYEQALANECPGLDLILTPAVAFDKSFNRLGHGKGFYDRYIKAASAHAEVYAMHPPTVIGLALKEQILDTDRVPTGPLDEVMDAIVTSDGFEWCREG